MPVLIAAIPVSGAVTRSEKDKEPIFNKSRVAIATVIGYLRALGGDEFGHDRAISADLGGGTGSRSACQLLIQQSLVRQPLIQRVSPVMTSLPCHGFATREPRECF